jgi:hypothetical protein
MTFNFFVWLAFFSLAAAFLECPDTSSCEAIPKGRKVFVVNQADSGAAFSTVLYLYVVNAVHYAWHHNSIPTVVFSASNSTKASFATENLWTEYFKPYCSGDVLAWARRCGVPVHSKKALWSYRRLHMGYAASVFAWYYGNAGTQCRRSRSCNQLNSSAYALWRQRGAEVPLHSSHFSLFSLSLPYSSL